MLYALQQYHSKRKADISYFENFLWLCGCRCFILTCARYDFNLLKGYIWRAASDWSAQNTFIGRLGSAYGTTLNRPVRFEIGYFWMFLTWRHLKLIFMSRYRPFEPKRHEHKSRTLCGHVILYEALQSSKLCWCPAVDVKMIMKILENDQNVITENGKFHQAVVRVHIYESPFCVTLRINF